MVSFIVKLHKLSRRIKIVVTFINKTNKIFGQRYKSEDKVTVAVGGKYV